MCSLAFAIRLVETLLKRRVPAVLHRIVCAACQHGGDFRPSVAQPLVCVQ